ncbi:DUF6233 domain-containing protein [Streptomyces sp. NPDC001156]
MNDLSPSRLDLLHFARRVVVQQATAALVQIDGWIAAEEQREAARQRAEEMRPPSPDWIIEQGLNRESPPVYVHIGGCWSIGKRHRGINREQARRALAEGVDPCPHCRPDSELGVLD